VTNQLISFEGSGDDTVRVIIDGTPTEFEAYNAEEGAQFHVVSRSGQMQVTVRADPNSDCWGVEVGQTSDVYPNPGWETKLEQSPDCDFATRVTITAPTDAELVFNP
jgi:hypothetical protein